MLQEILKTVVGLKEIITSGVVSVQMEVESVPLSVFEARLGN